MTAGATTAADAAAIVEAYFTAPSGGFEAAYLGDPASLDPVLLGEGESVDPGPTALAPELRAALSGLAMGALLDGDLPGLAGSERGALARRGGEALFGAAAGLVTLRAQTGVAEERIERTGAENAAQRTALETARSGITDADPFTTATELESVTAQLEILFSLTARVSQLSLSSFLR
ncbi:hypothetical protein DDZ14_04395 [Maritimibacter sp. 55A14]|uniref:flagellin n=1 Tax=Maritimibacter sp. 55A14 TaxID=2174844 RepID=UPI000D609862|nr:flagellin [Maritimibacter sp. 55A14]PWE33443.1 hypothetical protein DDZ14_04395 [Maritimibacter sp. 55A14]